MNKTFEVKGKLTKDQQNDTKEFVQLWTDAYGEADGTMAALESMYNAIMNAVNVRDCNLFKKKYNYIMELNK